MTLSTCQGALEEINLRARAGTATDLDVALARIYVDALKYLTPALEASMQQTTNENDIVEKLMSRADNTPPLPAHNTPALPRGSKPES
jgi:outer membrane protein TolC